MPQVSRICTCSAYFFYIQACIRLDLCERLGTARYPYCISPERAAKKQCTCFSVQTTKYVLQSFPAYLVERNSYFLSQPMKKKNHGAATSNITGITNIQNLRIKVWIQHISSTVLSIGVIEEIWWHQCYFNSVEMYFNLLKNPILMLSMNVAQW